MADRLFIDKLFAGQGDQATGKVQKVKLEPFITAGKTMVAIDNSGSTAGTILNKTLNFIDSALGHKSDIEDVYTWNDCAQPVCWLGSITASGGTYPATIIPILEAQKYPSLLITTDGLISRTDVAECSSKLEKTCVRNVVAVLLQCSDSTKPRELPISVFYPFLTLCQKRGGCFIILSLDYRTGELYLLMKHSPSGEGNNLPTPPAEFGDETSWDMIPKLGHLGDAFSLLNEKLIVNQIPTATDEERTIQVGDLSVNINKVCEQLKSREEELLDIGKWPETDAFVGGPLADIAAAAVSSELNFAVRKFISAWYANRYAAALATFGSSPCDSLLQEYRKLTSSSSEKRSEETNKAIARISAELFPAMSEYNQRKKQLLAPIASVHSKIMQLLSDAEKEDSTIPADFTLGGVTRTISNRAKRARTVDASSCADDTADSWDLEHATKCTECDICGAEGRPAAFILVDLAQVDPDAVVYNLSDSVIDDPLGSGWKSEKAIPSGNFCVQCAYACAAMGFHPYTRQPVSGVLVAADISGNPKNRQMMCDAICRSLLGGKKLPNVALMLFLSLLDGVSGKRGIEDTVHHIWNNIIASVKVNLFPAPLGTEEVMIGSMKRLVEYPLNEIDKESWMVPIRRHSTAAVSVIARSLLRSYPGNDELREKCIGMFRRTVFKAITSSYVSALKRTTYSAMRDKIESMLFDTSKTSIALFGSHHLCGFKEDAPKLFSILFASGAPRTMWRDIEFFCRDFEISLEKDLIPKEAFTMLLVRFYNMAESVSCYSSTENILLSMVEGSSVMADVFFGRTVTENQIMDILAESAPYRLYIRKPVPSSNSASHLVDSPCYGPHLHGPPISFCGVCGERFDITGSDSLDQITARKAQHFQQFYNSDPCGYPTNKSWHCSMHRAVREVIVSNFSRCTRPTRGMIEMIMAKIRSVSEQRRGYIYDPKDLHEAVCIAWDFIKKMQGRTDIVALNEQWPEDKLMIERAAIRNGTLVYGKCIATTEGLTEEELTTLLSPFTH